MGSGDVSVLQVIVLVATYRLQQVQVWTLLSRQHPLLSVSPLRKT
jgi:hypothetical protein